MTLAVHKAAPRALGQARNRRARKATPFEAALNRWLTRFARFEAAEALKGGAIKIRKVDEDSLRDDLRQLLRRFGLRAVGDSVNRVAGRTIIRGNQFDEALRGVGTEIQVFQEWNGRIEERVDDLMATTKDLARASVRRIVTESFAERPRPSIGEVARRIRTQFHGTGDRIPAFSSERAALIARTELVQAENSGIHAGYVATGVKAKEWLAFVDGRSGRRHHERMNGKIVGINDTFHTPLGNNLRFPGDPRAPIADTAQCRCSLASVRVKE